ncbi:MAG: hypothetical protein RL766_2146, partial [Bacteroidota bacterium]
MELQQIQIDALNDGLRSRHQRAFSYQAEQVDRVEDIITKLTAFQVAIPSWALGAG